MADTVETLTDILMPPEDAAEEKRTELESTERMQQLRGKLAKEVDPSHWPGTFGLIVQKIGVLAAIPIVEDIFIKVWNDAKLFQKYLDAKKYPADETIQVPLLEHEIKSTHSPYLEVRLDERVIDKIDFEITVKFKIKGAQLDIQDGQIKKFSSGECKAETSLKCEGFLLFSEKFKPIRLPGNKEFEKPIPILAA